MTCGGCTEGFPEPVRVWQAGGSFAGYPGARGAPRSGAPRGSSAYGRQRRFCARKGREILAKSLGVKLSRFHLLAAWEDMTVYGEQRCELA